MEDTTCITDPYIWVTDNLITVRQCNAIIKKFEKNIDKSSQGMTADGVQLLVKNSRDLVFSKERGFEKEDKLFHKIVSEMLEGYLNHIKTAGGFELYTTGQIYYCFPHGYQNSYSDTGYQLQKTEPGKGYVWHHDFTGNRVMTFIIYLNSVQEGWTQFYNGDQVSPKAGRGVIFPATWTYVHQGYPPLQTKYIVTGWLHSND